MTTLPRALLGRIGFRRRAGPRGAGVVAAAAAAAFFSTIRTAIIEPSYRSSRGIASEDC